MSRWFRTAVKGNAPMNAEEELQYLQEAEQALMHLLNDDISAADIILEQHDSSYHQLGRGISSFIASMLGVEKDLLKNASALLLAAENKTYEDMKKAAKEPGSFESAIYPPGTEYELCYCIAMLCSAITSVLGGSITSAVSGFYKLRKAYLTLSNILEIEEAFIRKRRLDLRGLTSVKTNGSTTTGDSLGSRPTSQAGSIKSETGRYDASKPSSSRPSVELSTPVEDEFLKEIGSLNLDADAAATKLGSRKFDLDPGMISETLTHHTDVFIYAGSHLAFGLLLIVLSMVDNPVFNKILYIIGFKGDRERGVEMLWQATKFSSFTSCTAGLSLLGYYNGLVGFCDILPTDAAAKDDLAWYPKERCAALLAEMQRLNPDSRLWKLEEARSLSYDRKLKAAIKILDENSTSNMKQIAVINTFEKSLTTMFYHDYIDAANSWLHCAELNTWSHTLYFYIAGTCYVEIYRTTKDQQYKDLAIEHIRKAPTFAGRQKVMSKQLPFEVYVARKVQKWEERAKAWNVDLIDAIGVSPVTEMCYLWNGIKKMSSVELDKSMAAIQWEKTSNPEKFQADFDEAALYHLLRACVLRNQHQHAEAKAILETELLVHDRAKFKGPLQDDWTCPAAHYEMACLAWNEKDVEGADHKAKVLECEEALKATQTFETYVLDARMGIKITTSFAAVKRHKTLLGI